MGYGSPLTLLLEESGVLTDCSIQTQDADEVLDFDFCSSNVVNRVILKADCVREVFAELDMSSDSLEILLSPSPPFCRLSTSGFAGTTQVGVERISQGENQM
jgi:cell cycle checkpoint protein